MIRSLHLIPTRVAAFLLLAATSVHAAVINLNLLNTQELVDLTSTPLLGNDVSGDLVQLLTLGINGVIDPVDAFSGLPGDDQVFGLGNNPTHVGAGTFGPDNDSGLLVQTNIPFDDSLVGLQVYVRYWDSSTIGTASAYGVTPILTIPAPLFGESTLNFAVSGSGTFQTDTPFLLRNPDGIPEPGSVVLAFLACIGVHRWRMFRQVAITPEQLKRVRGLPMEEAS